MENRVVLYLKAEQFVEVTQDQVTIGDLLTMTSKKKEMLQELDKIVILKKSRKGNQEESQRYVITILKIIEMIQEKYPDLMIQNIGATDIIVQVGKKKKQNKAVQILTVIVVMLIAFCGAAFSTMAFVNDGGVVIIMENIYELMTGEKSDGFTILEVSYSIGLVFGVAIFFNRIGKKKETCDPTPMEIEMRKYEEDIQTTVIQNYSRQEIEIDADS